MAYDVGKVMAGDTKLKVGPFSPKVALASTGAATSIVETLELSQVLSRVTPTVANTSGPT